MKLLVIALLVLANPSLIQSTFAKTDCTNIQQSICDFNDEDLNREAVKSILSNDAIYYAGLKSGHYFKNFNEFNIYLSQNPEANDLPLIMARYHGCLNALAIDLYDSKIPLAPQSCSFVNQLDKISSTLQERLQKSKLKKDFETAKLKTFKHLHQEKIFAYLNAFNLKNIKSNFLDYFQSTELTTSMDDFTDISDTEYLEACGLNGLQYNAYNASHLEQSQFVPQPNANHSHITLKSKITYCPAYILSMINVKKVNALYYLPSDHLKNTKQHLTSFYYETAPENGRFVLYHEFSHCVTIYHSFLKYTDPVGKSFLSCFDKKFGESFTYEDKTQEWALIDQIKQHWSPAKNTSLFIDETMADHLAAHLLSQDLLETKSAFSLLKQNMRPFCSFKKKNEALYSLTQSGLHPNGNFRINQAVLNDSIRKSIGCNAISNNNRCNYAEILNDYIN